MQATTIETAPLSTEGILQRADDSARKLYVLVNDDLLTFDVPQGCGICLGAEQVGLRQLTPLDHVQVAYAQVSGVNVAHSIHASWFPFSSTAR
jgi:hypothetical protein